MSNEKVRLIIYSTNGTAFNYLCDRSIADKAYDVFKLATSSKIEVLGTINHCDANEAKAIFDIENIGNIEIIEVKGF